MEGIGQNPLGQKTCLITGATSGIGKAAAAQIARLGATVVLVGRNPQKTAAAVAQIQEQSGNPEIHSLLADLSSQRAIRQLAEDYQARYPRLDVLVNNAGALMLSRQVSVDGIELTFALNHLNYFLLTNLLLDVLQSGSPSRVINVSSAAHQGARLDFEDLECKRRYGGYLAYGKSKLANLLFTYELARRLEGAGISVNAMHPGLVASGFLGNNGLRGKVVNTFVRLFGRSVNRGARTITYLASSSDVAGVTGRYFMDEAPMTSSVASYDGDAARQLWEASEQLTGHKFQFPRQAVS
jgi:NAD(P)-dependent dehydrogenase (short-subunit alcohol dehydrogenase family)